MKAKNEIMARGKWKKKTQVAQLAVGVMLLAELPAISSPPRYLISHEILTVVLLGKTTLDMRTELVSAERSASAGEW
nr:hypothetical protein CFP56_79203 [Quercus suber]